MILQLILLQLLRQSIIKKKRKNINEIESTPTYSDGSAASTSIDVKQSDPSTNMTTTTVPLDNKAKKNTVNENECTPTGSSVSVSGVSIELKKTDPTPCTNTLPLENETEKKL